MEQLKIDESLLHPDLSFEELGADSLDMFDLLTAIEAEFDIELDDESFEACETLGQMMDLIRERLKD